jgi:hypothetical protein
VPSASVDVRRDRDAWWRSCVVERFTRLLNVVLARVRVPSASVAFVIVLRPRFVVAATRGGEQHLRSWRRRAVHALAERHG